uniref:Uncharacterized protein MANES_02G076400 n=1 Tax=Rhizophora mucronata TaxID=61149 RepID=A0A2P2M739_RHIMU
MLSWNQTRKQSLFPPLPSCYFLTVKQKLEQNDQHQTLSAVLVSIDSSVPKTPTFQSRLFCWHRKTSHQKDHQVFLGRARYRAPQYTVTNCQQAYEAPSDTLPPHHPAQDTLHPVSCKDNQGCERLFQQPKQMSWAPNMPGEWLRSLFAIEIQHLSKDLT